MSRSRELLASLISFDTTSRESNLKLIEFVTDYLTQFKVPYELIFNDEKSKANLFATLGPSDCQGIVLSGHTDVVPVDGQHWSTDPFQLTEKEGRLYGRGTADMKGYIACVLAAVPGFLAAPLRMPIHIALSYDEEIGCLGVRSLINELEKRTPKPQLCLIGEPTTLQPVVGHKGKLSIRCDVHGAACHSAYAPEGVNAIEYAADLITQLGRIARDLRDARLCDARFDPPFSTVQTGIVHGGEAINIVPADCYFDYEIRALPTQDPREINQQLEQYAEQRLLPNMRAVNAASSINFSELSSYPGLLTDTRSVAAQLIAQICQSDDFTTVAFGTEGGLYDAIGIPTLICGPGSIEQAHKPDEYISIQQLADCDRMLGRLTLTLRA